MEYLILKNWCRIPLLGFGTSLLDGVNSKQAFDLVAYALKIGYRHIDTAWIYRNEDEVGSAIKQSNIKREDIWITTKYPPIANSTTPGFIEYCIYQQLKRLKTDYIDLYLIHWPRLDKYNLAVWRVLERLHEKGILKTIGVSNFWRHHLEALLKKAKVRPQINQIQISPYYYPYKLINYCKKEKIYLSAHSIFNQGELNNDIIKKISFLQKATPAQVILRWGISQDIIMIGDFTTNKSISSSFKIADLSLNPYIKTKILNQANGRNQISNPESIDFSGIDI